MVSRQALVSVLPNRCSGSTQVRLHLHARSPLRRGVNSSRLSEAAPTLRTRARNAAQHDRIPLASRVSALQTAAASPVTHRCQEPSWTPRSFVRSRCTQSSRESVRSLRVQFYFRAVANVSSPAAPCNCRLHVSARRRLVETQPQERRSLCFLLRLIHNKQQNNVNSFGNTSEILTGRGSVIQTESSVKGV